MIDNFVEQDYHSYDPVYRHENANTIYIGDVQSAMNLEFIAQANIKTIVTAARDMDHLKYPETVSHIVYSLLDSKSEDISILFDGFYQLVEDSMKKGSLLVHCAAGISRSSTLVISYIMKKQKKCFKEAITMVRIGRPAVLPNLGFERQLKKYEEVIKKENHLRQTKRLEVKTCESDKINLGMVKTQILPMLGVYGSNKMKQKFIAINKPNLPEKYSQKDIQILKIYNHGSQLNRTKKNFPQSKKSTSFSRHDEQVEQKIKIHLPDRAQIMDSIRNLQQSKKKRLKNPFMEIKQCYMWRKNNNLSLDKRSPTERGFSFYHMRGKRLM